MTHWAGVLILMHPKYITVNFRFTTKKQSIKTLIYHTIRYHAMRLSIAGLRLWDQVRILVVDFLRCLHIDESGQLPPSCNLFWYGRARYALGHVLGAQPWRCSQHHLILQCDGLKDEAMNLWNTDEGK
jgi:hypothetical protein